MHRAANATQALAAAFCLAATLAFLPPSAEAEEVPRSLTLTGTGEVSAPPDMATIQIGVTSEGDTARAALDANTAAMNRVMENFGKLNIASKDLRTSGFNVQPRYFHDPKQNVAPRVVGYEVNNTVHVTIRDLSGLGRVLDSAVSEGSNAIQSLNFSFSEPGKLLDEARRLAGTDARRKAGLFAEALGVKLGDITQISEAGDGPRPIPVMMRAAAMEAADVPISAGEQSVSASVNVTWEIE